MKQIAISNTTLEFSDFVSQFEDAVATRDSWAGTLTTQTSQTLIELIASLGVFHNGRLIRCYEDAFPETVQSDRAATSIAVMQGLRLSRKAPTSLFVELLAPIDINLSNYSQFSINGYLFFNRDQIELEADTPLRVELYQGEVVVRPNLTGTGTNFQIVASSEDNFTVSDTDVIVMLNGAIIEKSMTGLWNFKDKQAYQDLTLPDGRLCIQFGSGGYGAIPTPQDTLGVLYVVTLGTQGAQLTTLNAPVVLLGQTLVNGTALSNPTGGGDEKDTWVYKNIAAGAAGTLGSAVTPGQYHGMVLNYPGIIDAKTQAQRDINPQNKEWMNVFRVAALTESPWTPNQIFTFLRAMEVGSMKAGVFLWQEPIPIYWEIDLDIYCFNTAILDVVATTSYDRIVEMFRPQPLLLGMDFFKDDIAAAVRKANGGAVSHVIVNLPEQNQLLASAPYTPPLYADVVIGEGTLTQLVYAYSIAVDTEDVRGTPTTWVYPQVVGHNVTAGIRLTWLPFPGAVHYHLWGRQAGQIGILATINAGQPLTYLDRGTTTPAAPPAASLDEAPVRYHQIAKNENGDLLLNIRVHYTNRGRLEP